MGAWDKTVALVLFTVACFTSLGAYIGYDSACVSYEGAEACFGRPTEFVLYVALSLVGLVAAGFMLHFAFRGSRRAFLAVLVAALVVYAVSILFADAGTHGWDNLKVFPNLG